MDAMPTGYTVRVGLLVAAWIVLTGLLIATGFAVVHSSTVNAFDRHVTSTVVAQRTPALNTAMKALTWLGSWVALVLTAVIVLVLAFRRRLAWLAVALAVLAWGGESAGVWLGKHVVQRQRPPKDIWLKSVHGWSWPSGHTAVAVIVFAILAMALTRLLRSRFTRLATWAVAVVSVCAVGFSRIELGVHWTTDVLASVFFASGWLVAIVALFAHELGAAQSHERTRMPIRAAEITES